MAGDPYGANAARGNKNSAKMKVWKWSGTAPKFINFDKPGDWDIVIVPHKIVSDQHPTLQVANMEVGDLAINMDYWVHGDVGPGKAKIVCPNATWGKACPVCEAQEEANQRYGWDSKEAKALKPKHRAVYNVVDYTDRKKDPVVTLVDVSFPLFDDELRKAAESSGRREGLARIPYANLEYLEWVVLFESFREKFGTNEFTKYGTFGFKNLPQGKELDPALYDDAIDPSEGLLKMSYDEITKLMLGDEDDGPSGDGDEPAPSRDRSERPSREERGGRGERETRTEDPPAREGRGSREETPVREGRSAREEAPAREERAPREERGRRDEPAPERGERRDRGGRESASEDSPRRRE